MKAVFHDVDEVVTGDIPRPTKYFSNESKQIFDKIASQGMKQIISELDIKNQSSSQEIEKLWKNSKDGDEGRIVALADLAAVVYKIWEEVMLLGNKKLILQGKQVFGYIEDFSESFEQQEVDSHHRIIIGEIITQLMDIASEISEMEDPMIGTLASLNNQETN
jgi:5'-deoxynucleotidase YfbR-like HD superfamily hydrolase